MYWLAELLPAEYRCWILGIRFWGQAVTCAQDSLECQAMNTQWVLWHAKGETSLDGKCWIGGFLETLEKIKWGTDKRKRNLEQVTSLKVDEKSGWTPFTSWYKTCADMWWTSRSKKWSAH